MFSLWISVATMVQRKTTTKKGTVVPVHVRKEQVDNIKHLTCALLLSASQHLTILAIKAPGVYGGKVKGIATTHLLVLVVLRYLSQ